MFAVMEVADKGLWDNLDDLVATMFGFEERGGLLAYFNEHKVSGDFHCDPNSRLKRPNYANILRSC